MRVEDLVVEVRDRDLGRRGQIALKDLDLELSVQHRNVGSWKVVLPREHHLTPILQSPGSGLVVWDRHDVLLSGPMVSANQDATPQDRAGTVTFEGVGDTVILADMQAWPEPANGDVTTQKKSHDVRTGPIETLMHAYVEANVGPKAPDGRRNTRLVMGTDYGRGPSITKSARFEKLGEMFAEMSLPTELGFRIVQRGDVLVFETFEGRDLTKLVRFSMHNRSLAGEKIAVTAPTVTHVQVAGSGRYSDRTFVEFSSDESLESEELWGRRIEHFLDQRQTSVTAEYEAAATEVLAGGGSTGINIQAVPAEDSTDEYGKDWSVGDSITVEIDGREMTSRVAGFVLKATSQGFMFGAVVGDLAAFDTQVQTAQRVSKVESRVSAIERNAESAVPAPAGTNVLTRSTGWSIISQRWLRSGPVVQCYVTVERTGANISATNGNYSNSLVGTIPAKWAPLIQAPTLSGATGPSVHGALMEDGRLVLASGPSGESITTGMSLSFAATYLVDEQAFADAA